MKLKKLLLVCGFGLLYSSLFAVNASVPEYDNIPINSQTWQEVDLTYDKYIDGKKYTEKANILRPIDWLEKRKLNRHGESLMHLSEEDIGFDVIATVIAIKPTNINFNNDTANQSVNRPVIGTFLKYSNHVADYTFEDVVTHKQETIQATPEHPFYSVDRHNYIPIGQIWRDYKKHNDKEELQTDNGNNVILVNVKPHGSQVEAVYNFEVYKSHNYMVGNKKFLVHNEPGGCSNAVEVARLSDNANRIYNKYVDHGLVGVFNTETKEIDLFPALEISKDKTGAMERIVVDENKKGAWSRVYRNEQLQIVKEEKLNNIPTTRLNRKRYRHLPRDILNDAGNSRVPHMELLNYLGKNKYKDSYRGFYVKRLNGQNPEFTWKSRSLNPNPGFIEKNYQTMIEEAFMNFR